MRPEYMLLAISAPCALASPKVIPFQGHIASIGNTTTMDITLLAGSQCSVEYQTLPYTVDCTLIVGVKNGGVDLKATLYGGLRLATVNGEFEATAVYQASLPRPKLDGSWDTLTIPNVKGSYTYKTPTQFKLIALPEVCGSQVLKRIPTPNPQAYAAAQALAVAVAATGSNACIGIDLKADRTFGAKASLVLKVDLLNEKLIGTMVRQVDSVMSLPGDQAEQAVIAAGYAAVQYANNNLKLKTIHKEIDIGKVIIDLVRSKINQMKGKNGNSLRHLAATDITTDFIDSNGEFLFGNQAGPSSTSSSTLAIGGGATGAVLLAAVVAIAVKRRVTRGAHWTDSAVKGVPSTCVINPIVASADSK